MKARKQSGRRWWVVGGVVVCGLVAAVVMVNWPREEQGVAGPAITFEEITESSGVSFTHHSGVTPWKLLPESMGSGVVVIDYDRDGRPDLLLLNGCPWPGQSREGPTPTMKLFRNLGDSRFEDVTEEMGLGVPLQAMGGTVGDHDNDGWPDLFVTGVGGNRLFRNEGGKRFRDVSRAAGVEGSGGWPVGFRGDFSTWRRPLNWSTSATWLDYDGDGLLDLFVCNYVAWSPAKDVEQGFRLSSGERAYGPPRAFAGTQNILYRNRGDGTFEDVSKSAGIEVSERGEPVGKSLGVIACDVDEDGWPDLLVANDTTRNFFFHNVEGSDGKRVFREIGEASGVAYADRHARGAMGIDWGAGCVEERNAILIGNFADEPNTFLVQQRPRDLRLIDLASSEGIAGPSRRNLKFGLFFFDVDLDGRLDFLTCNGHLEPDIARANPEESYAQPTQLFWNRGDARPRFRVVTGQQIGRALVEPIVGRGCAYLDLDGDGSLDVAMTANGGRAKVLRNVNRTGNHWIRLRLEGDGKRSNRSAVGARVIVEAGGQRQYREVSAARGYLSQSELVVTIGLGKVSRIDRVTIHWPGREVGRVTVLEEPAIDREHHIVQGQ